MTYKVIVTCGLIACISKLARAQLSVTSIGSLNLYVIEHFQSRLFEPTIQLKKESTQNSKEDPKTEKGDRDQR